MPRAVTELPNVDAGFTGAFDSATCPFDHIHTVAAAPAEELRVVKDVSVASNMLPLGWLRAEEDGVDDEVNAAC